jgi:effector-binding domain-containing protein
MESHSEEVVVEEREAEPTASVRGTVAVAGLTEAQGVYLRALWSFLEERGLGPAGPPFVRYHTFGESETDFEVGVPIAEQAAGAGRVESGELPDGTAASTWHFGAHDRLGEAYARLGAWIQDNGRVPAGAAWEVYHWIDLTMEPDPATWPPPSEWRTQLIQPIR